MEQEKESGNYSKRSKEEEIKKIKNVKGSVVTKVTTDFYLGLMEGGVLVVSCSFFCGFCLDLWNFLEH